MSSDKSCSDQSKDPSVVYKASKIFSAKCTHLVVGGSRFMRNSNFWRAPIPVLEEGGTYFAEGLPGLTQRVTEPRQDTEHTVLNKIKYFFSFVDIWFLWSSFVIFDVEVIKSNQKVIKLQYFYIIIRWIWVILDTTAEVLSFSVLYFDHKFMLDVNVNEFGWLHGGDVIERSRAFVNHYPCEWHDLRLCSVINMKMCLILITLFDLFQLQHIH